MSKNNSIGITTEAFAFEMDAHQGHPDRERCLQRFLTT